MRPYLSRTSGHGVWRSSCRRRLPPLPPLRLIRGFRPFFTTRIVRIPPLLGWSSWVLTRGELRLLHRPGTALLLPGNRICLHPRGHRAPVGVLPPGVFDIVLPHASTNSSALYPLQDFLRSNLTTVTEQGRIPEDVHELHRNLRKSSVFETGSEATMKHNLPCTYPR